MSNKVYSFGRMKIKDYNEYINRYGVPFIKLLPKYNGKLLAATKKGMLVEGKEDGNWTVLMEFASGQDAYAFYNSPEYGPLKKLRLEELTEGALAITFPAELPTQ